MLKKTALMLSLAVCAALGTAQLPASAQPFGPPAPYAERIPPAPGPHWFWVAGHWRWNGFRWVWVRGHYAHRPGYAGHWVPGHYVHGPGRWHWVEGHWS